MIKFTNEGLEYYKKHFRDINDKLHLLDQLTPFYLGILDNLSPRSKHIIYILAERADSMSAGDIGRKIRVESKNVSVTLNQLFLKELIQRKSVNDKNFVYYIEDKTFLEWTIMRWNLKVKNN